MLTWLDRESDGVGSKVRVSLERFRWGEIVVLLAILVVSYKGLGQTWNHSYLPKVSETWLPCPWSIHSSR